jgi:hypothetical protein
MKSLCQSGVEITEIPKTDPQRCLPLLFAICHLLIAAPEPHSLPAPLEVGEEFSASSNGDPAVVSYLLGSHTLPMNRILPVSISCMKKMNG